MIEIDQFEGITQIKMSREINGAPVYWVAAYLVDGLLIDTGCSYTIDELVKYLEEKEVNKVVNTHFHEDHVGANKAIKERFGVEIFAHPDSARRIAEKIELYPYQEMVWGYPEPTNVKPIPQQIKTEKYSFKVIETPGHSEGHIAIVELSKGWCFSGDIFAREKPKFIRPEEDVVGMIKSMKMLIDLPCERLILFTSVGKIVENGRKALTECIGYLSDMSLKAFDFKNQGMGVEEIIKNMFGGEHNFAGITGGHYSTKNFVCSLLKAG